MKNFILMMMVTVIYTASIPTDLPLQIHKEADNVTKKQLDIDVPEASVNSNICTNEFFCLAEKSLEHVNLPTLEKLKRLLHQYNKDFGTQNCTEKLDKKRLYRLFKLLKDIKDCTPEMKKHPKQKTHH